MSTSRKVTVISTSLSGKKEFNTEANTVGDLKKALTANGIDIQDMDLLEGKTKTCLTNDQSTLPSGIEYRGETSDDLVIMLSTSNKKIRSGRLSLTRKELIKKVTDFKAANPNASESWGNPTRMSSEQLVRLMSTATPQAPVSKADGIINVLLANNLISATQANELKSL